MQHLDYATWFEWLWKVTEHPFVNWLIVGLLGIAAGLYTFWRKDNRSQVKNLWAMLEPRTSPEGGKLWFILRAERFVTLDELFPGDWWLRRKLRQSGSGRRLPGFRDVDFIPLSRHKGRMIRELRSFLSGLPQSGWFAKACHLAGSDPDKVNGLLTCEQIHTSDKCFRFILMHPDVVQTLPTIDPETVEYEEPNHKELLMALVAWAKIHEGETESHERARLLIGLTEIELT